MSEATFLEYHNNGLGKLLGISILSSAANRVVSEMQVSGEHMTAEDVVHGGIIMSIADCTAAYGAVLNMPESCTTATIESKTNFLRKGTGARLRAESVPIHVGRTMSVWRTQVLRGQGRPIAEITQTQIYRPTEANPAAATQSQHQPLERASGEATPANLTVLEGGPARTRRGATVEDRKRQIFEGACEVIARKGFANASIREIATAAKMPVPTMYQYIEGKNDLLLVLYQYFMDDVGQAMRKAISPDLPPAQNLERVIRAMIDIFDVHQPYIRLMFQETKSLDPAARQKVYELDGDNIAILRPLLEACKDAGECDFDDVEIAANQIYFHCGMWPLRRWTLKKHGFDAVGDAAVKFIINGLTGRR